MANPNQAQPMTLQQMINAINSRVDDAVNTTDAVGWLNAGKNQMAVAIGANFPDLDPNNLDDTFVFDAIYHEAPILYACAKFKEQDSALSEVANFMTQFENLKKEFVGKYTVPPRYRNDRLTQQFIATAGQTDFTITAQNYDPRYGNLSVYVNDVPCDQFRANSDRTFTVFCTLNDGDAVTAIWEEHEDYIQPPFEWWNDW